jgi:hypothetical protein
VNLRKYVLLLVLTLLPFDSLHATAQTPEVLRFEGKSYDLETVPLSEYLASHPGVIPESKISSTGLWRGYIGTWALRDQKLYLEDIRILTSAAMDSDASESERSRSVIAEVFKTKEPVHATWFTGRLIVPTGEMVDYVHMGFASTYSAYLVVTVVDGNVTEMSRMNLTQFQKFRRRQFELFKQTAEYVEAVADLRKRDRPMTAEQIEDFLFQVNTGRFDSRLFETPATKSKP